MPVKDAFEVFMKIFHCDRTQLMEEVPDLYPIIGVGLTSRASSHQETILLLTLEAQFGHLGMDVA
jgi:hypothetical protein